MLDTLPAEVTLNVLSHLHEVLESITNRQA